MNPDKKRPVVRFEQLTPLGRTIWFAGAAVYLGTRVVDSSIRHVSRIAVETRRAFREGLSRPERGTSDLKNGPPPAV